MFTFCILFHENDTKPHFCHHFAQCDIMYPVSRKEWLHYLFMNNNQSSSYNYQHNIYIPTPLSRNRNFSFLHTSYWWGFLFPLENMQEKYSLFGDFPITQLQLWQWLRQISYIMQMPYHNLQILKVGPK